MDEFSIGSCVFLEKDNQKGWWLMDFDIGNSRISEIMIRNAQNTSGSGSKAVDKKNLSPWMQYLSDAKDKTDKARMEEVTAQKKRFQNTDEETKADGLDNRGMTADELRDLYYRMQGYNLGWDDDSDDFYRKMSQTYIDSLTDTSNTGSSYIPNANRELLGQAFDNVYDVSKLTEHIRKGRQQ